MGKNLEELSTLELIATIEAKNHRFKIAGFIFASAIAVGLVVLLVLGLSTLDGVNSQLKSQKTLLNSQHEILANIQASGVQRTHQLNDLQNHIDCIVELLRQPNHVNLTIKDLNGCQFDSNGNIISPPATNTTTPQKSSAGATAQPKASSTPQAPSTPVTPPQSPLQNIFCKIDLVHLACR